IPTSKETRINESLLRLTLIGADEFGAADDMTLHRLLDVGLRRTRLQSERRHVQRRQHEVIVMRSRRRTWTTVPAAPESAIARHADRSRLKAFRQLLRRRRNVEEHPVG